MPRRSHVTHLATLWVALAVASPAATQEAAARVLDRASPALEPYTLEAVGDEVTIDFTAGWTASEAPAYDPVVLGARAEGGDYRVRVARDRHSLVLDDGAAERDVAFDFSDGASHHVLLRTAATKTRVFIDGSDLGELDAAFPVGPETTFFVGSAAERSDPFPGEIHALRLWREALAPESLAQLASGSPGAGDDPAPVAFLDFVDDRPVFAGTETQVLDDDGLGGEDVVASRSPSNTRQSRIGSHRNQADGGAEGGEAPPQEGGTPPPNRPPPPVPGQAQVQADEPPPLAPVPGGRPPPNRPPPPIPGQQPAPQAGNPPRPPGLPPHLAQQAAAQQPGGPQAPAVGQPMGLPPGFPRPPPRPRLRLEPNSPRVYDGPVVPRYDAGRAGRQYPGRAVVGANGVARLQPGNGRGELGAYLGGGANSWVYRTRTPNRVMKVVSLGEAGNTDAKARTIRDQMAGRAILSDVLTANPRSPFRITQQDGPPELVEKTVNGRTYKFAITTEENISSEVRDGRGRLLGNATNAADRARLKGGLSLAEELTISTVIRDLNRHGIVWTDHKLENLDVVPDATSPTGHRVVFFDFDGFRPVNGGDGPTRAQLAKNLQAEFDSFSGWENLQQRLGGRRPNEFFDYTALGERMGTLATPNANTRRQAYRDFSRLDDTQLQKAVQTVAATPP